ncbi:MAG: SLC13 family permease [Moorellales bacterium]
MSQAQPELRTQPATSGWLRTLIRIFIGPVLFLIVQALPLGGLEPPAHFALSCYVWIIAWWVTQPVPWAVAGFLPLVLFPLGGAMSFKDTIALYGQPVFPFLMGVMLFGYAFEKHGLARRMAVSFLSLPGTAKSGKRLLLAIMVTTTVLSAFVDDAPAVAIMIPIALAIVRLAEEAYRQGTGNQLQTPRLTTAACLGVLYGSAAGGMATPAGVPFNPLAISLLEQLTGYKINFAQWTATGVFLAVAALVVYYLVLNFMSPPELPALTQAGDLFAAERKKLGPLTTAEKNVLAVFVLMIVLWFAPIFVKSEILSIWYVPPVAMTLLFLLPTDWRKGEPTLAPRDLQNGVLWNVLFLVVSGTAIASGLVKLGVVKWLQGVIAGSLSAAFLPWFAGLITPLLSHLTSGTATTTMVCSVLFPIAAKLGYNPAILARIIAGTALAVSVPWAGAAAGTCFSSGALRFGDMFRIGVVATVFTLVVITALSILLVPAFGAFSAP